MSNHGAAGVSQNADVLVVLGFFGRIDGPDLYIISLDFGRFLSYP